MVVSNITKRNLICSNCFRADTFWKRLTGLLGRSELSPEAGLLITPCRSVHTFGMRFPIDLVFLTADGRVVGLFQEMQPGRVSRVYHSARMVLELPAGLIRACGIEIGDLILFDK